MGEIIGQLALSNSSLSYKLTKGRFCIQVARLLLLLLKLLGGPRGAEGSRTAVSEE
jgi:hypothetical protein